MQVAPPSLLSEHIFLKLLLWTGLPSQWQHPHQLMLVFNFIPLSCWKHVNIHVYMSLYTFVVGKHDPGLWPVAYDEGSRPSDLLHMMRGLDPTDLLHMMRGLTPLACSTMLAAGVTVKVVPRQRMTSLWHACSMALSSTLSSRLSQKLMIVSSRKPLQPWATSLSYIIYIAQFPFPLIRVCVFCCCFLIQSQTWTKSNINIRRIKAELMRDYNHTSFESSCLKCQRQIYHYVFVKLLC